MSDQPIDERVAPQFLVPGVPIVSVEHPCIIQNVDKAIRMLGRESEISGSLAPENDKPLGLRFQPDDPTSREVISYNMKTANLLLKVTVPKRIRKKRKRASHQDLPTESTEISAQKDVRYLLQSLEDNPQRYSAELVGCIHSTHVWRTMPDFVYSSKASKFLGEVQTKILPQEYPRLKQWSMPRPPNIAAADTEAIPPPAFSTVSLPQNYAYRQDSSARNIVAKEASRDKRTTEEIVAEVRNANKEDSSSRPVLDPGLNLRNAEIID